MRGVGYGTDLYDVGELVKGSLALSTVFVGQLLDGFVYTATNTHPILTTDNIKL